MRKVIVILLAVLLLAVNVNAATCYVSDQARLLSSAETEALENSFKQYHTEYGFTVAAVTVDTLDGVDPAEYASQYYRKAGYDNDGVMLLISERDGLWYVYTSGVAAEVITDELIAKLGTQMTDELDGGRYYDAYKIFTKKCTTPVCDWFNSDALTNETQVRAHRVYVYLGLGGGLMVGIAAVIGLILLQKKFPQKN